MIYDANVIIGRSESEISELTDQQKMMVNHIADLERKIGTTQFNLDQLNVGKEAFVSLLTKSLEAPVEEAA